MMSQAEPQAQATAGTPAGGRLIVRLTDASALDIDVVGGKFAALGRAARAGLPVPPAFAVSTAARDLALRSGALPPGLAVGLHAAARELGFAGGFAVRSSAVREDLGQGSFAGVYRSLLEVPVEDLPAAVEACWKAAESPGLTAYLAARGLPPEAAGMGVVVQRMVRPRAAGVAFSRDPLRLDPSPHCVVEAVAGLGDGLASGLRTPWRAWVVPPEGGEDADADLRLEAPLDRGDAPPLESAAQWARVAALARRAEEAAHGVAQDVEWALDGGDRLWLLQARPITRDGGARLAAPPGRFTRAIAVDLWADRISPFLAGLLVREAPRWDLSVVARRLGLDPPRPTLAIIEGYLYVNVGALEASLAALPRWLRWPDLRELLPPGADLTAWPPPAPGRLARALAGLAWLVISEPEVLPPLSRPIARARLRREAARRDRRRWSSDRAGEGDAGALLERVDRAADAFVALQVENRWPYAHAAASVWLLRWLARTWGGFDAGEFLRLLADPAVRSENVTLRIEREFERLADELAAMATREGAEVAPDLLRRPPLDAAFASFIERWGSRARQRDLVAPRWREEPGQVEAMLVAAASAGRRADRRAPGISLAGSPLAGSAWPARWILRMLLRETRRFLDLREDLRFALDEALWDLRRALLAFGEATGAGQSTLYLERDELAALGAGAMTLEAALARAAHRRAAFEAPFIPPPFVLEGRPVEPLPDRGNVLRGLGTSPGRARGPVRVVSDPSRARLRPGDVLVGEHLDPGWTPILPGIAAVVVEEGGLLNHASIVAREFGIPAVVGIRDARQRLREGSRILVDGHLGVVVVEEGEAGETTAAPGAGAAGHRPLPAG